MKYHSKAYFGRKGSESVGHGFMKKAEFFLVEILFKFVKISADKKLKFQR